MPSDLVVVFIAAIASRSVAVATSSRRPRQAPRVLRADPRVVEAGRRAVRLDDLPVTVLEHERPRSVEDPGVPPTIAAAWRRS